MSQSPGRVYAIGDIHGHRDTLIRLLREAGLAGGDARWSGGAAELWFTGDLVARGPDNIGTLDFVMRLQAGAAAAGGRVEALLGNHEAEILGAHRFGGCTTTGPRGTFLDDWEWNGGRREDAALLRPEHAAWIADRPAMARVAACLCVHADNLLYLDYGRSIDEVNGALHTLLHGDDLAAWDRLLKAFRKRGAFDDGRPEGTVRAAQFLRTFGGERIVHGHHPICKMLQVPPEQVRAPYVYAGGRCANVDHGVYLGGAGFVFPCESDVPRR